MLHFLHNFVYYLTLEVIGPNAHEMEAGLQEARDMDQVICYLCVDSNNTRWKGGRHGGVGGRGWGSRGLGRMEEVKEGEEESKWAKVNLCWKLVIEDFTGDDNEGSINASMHLGQILLLLCSRIIHASNSFLFIILGHLPPSLLFSCVTFFFSSCPLFSLFFFLLSLSCFVRFWHYTSDFLTRVWSNVCLHRRYVIVHWCACIYSWGHFPFIFLFRFVSFPSPNSSHFLLGLAQDSYEVNDDMFAVRRSNETIHQQ